MGRAWVITQLAKLLGSEGFPMIPCYICKSCQLISETRSGTKNYSQLSGRNKTRIVYVQMAYLLKLWSNT